MTKQKQNNNRVMHIPMAMYKQLVYNLIQTVHTAERQQQLHTAHQPFSVMNFKRNKLRQ